MAQRKKATRGSGLPKLPKNGYKNVRKCGNSYQGYTPNKTHFTRVKPGPQRLLPQLLWPTRSTRATAPRTSRR